MMSLHLHSTCISLIVNHTVFLFMSIMSPIFMGTRICAHTLIRCCFACNWYYLHLHFALKSWCFLPTAWGGAPVPFCVGLLLQAYRYNLAQRHLSDRLQIRRITQTTDIPCRAGHEPVCLVLGWDPVCALLEFTEGPTHILRVFYSVVLGAITVTSPALDTAALCLSLWPASDLPFSSNFSQVSLCRLTADIRILSCKQRLHWHVMFFHGSRHLTKVAFYQFGILSTGQTYFPNIQIIFYLTLIY